mgnify:CR=1 FL=1|tara:strand:+ start:14 stop:1381 length:1368 start_codon:yes stop_codon:yes gene_type:complete
MNNSDLLINKKLTGWAKTNSVNCKVFSPIRLSEIKNLVKKSKPKSILPRGLGRSYGDAAQIKDKTVINLKNFNRINISKKEKTLRAGAGASIDQILKLIIPKGYFLSVLPGTSNVTVGGCIASDVHGKNHYIDGSFGSYILEIKLIDGKGDIKILKPNHNDPKIRSQFWATIGGMGLTGIIYEATFRIIEIETSLVSVDTFRFKDLDSLMKTMIEKEKSYKYIVAWIDSSDKNKRGILTCGTHAKIDQINNKEKLKYNPKSKISIPFFLPNGLVNKYTVKLFNFAWYRKYPKIRTKEIQTISKFFHPLDGLKNWNRIYGNEGFIQYQFVIPESASYLISKTLEVLKEINAPSFLTVLKRFGKGNEALLSFPSKGWTLTVDVPASNTSLENCLNKLDKLIVKENGKIYLSKDSRQTSEVFFKTYKNFEEWLKIKYEMDPKCIFTSDLAERYELFKS